MSAVDQSFLQYGAIGAMLLLMLSLFLWVFRAIFLRFLGHMDGFQKFMQEMVTAAAVLRNEVADNHHDLVERITELGSKSFKPKDGG